MAGTGGAPGGGGGGGGGAAADYAERGLREPPRVPPSVQTLRLTGNLLEALPAAGQLARASQLQNLFAGANRLRSAAPALSAPALLHAGLSYNNVASLADWGPAAAESPLISLDLSHNDLCSLDDALAHLQTLPALERLVLAGNPLCLCRDYAVRVARGLPRLKTLDGEPVSSAALGAGAGGEGEHPSPPAAGEGTASGEAEARGEVLVRVEIWGVEYAPLPRNSTGSAGPPGEAAAGDSSPCEGEQRVAGGFFVEIGIGRGETLSTRPPAAGESAEGRDDAEKEGAETTRGVTTRLSLQEARDLMRDGLRVKLVVVAHREAAAAEGADAAGDVESVPELGAPEGGAGPELERFERVVGQGLFQAQSLLRGGVKEEGALDFSPVPELTDEENILMALGDPRQPVGALGRCRVRVSLPAPEAAEPVVGQGAEAMPTEAL